MPEKTQGGIRIHRIERGEAPKGCAPTGIMILFRDSENQGGEATEYLRSLFKDRGYTVTDGEGDDGLGRLCIVRPGQKPGRFEPEEILAIMQDDPEIDLSSLPGE
jgi:hypothetical protein